MQDGDLAETIADRVGRLLDEIQDALRRADFAALPGMTAALALDLGGLEDSAAPAKALRALQHKAARNAGNLQAAGRGVRAARRRLDEIAAGGSGLATYDVKGLRIALQPTGQLARRV